MLHNPLPPCPTGLAPLWGADWGMAGAALSLKDEYGSMDFRHPYHTLKDRNLETGTHIPVPGGGGFLYPDNTLLVFRTDATTHWSSHPRWTLTPTGFLCTDADPTMAIRTIVSNNAWFPIPSLPYTPTGILPLWGWFSLHRQDTLNRFHRTIQTLGALLGVPVELPVFGATHFQEPHLTIDCPTLQPWITALEEDAALGVPRMERYAQRSSAHKNYHVVCPHTFYHPAFFEPHKVSAHTHLDCLARLKVIAHANALTL